MVWGDLDQPFVGFKIASMSYRKMKKHSPEQLVTYEAEMGKGDAEKFNLVSVDAEGHADQQLSQHEEGTPGKHQQLSEPTAL